MKCNENRNFWSTIVLIHVYFSYAATCINEDSAGGDFAGRDFAGGDFAEQLSPLIFF